MTNSKSPTTDEMVSFSMKREGPSPAKALPATRYVVATAILLAVLFLATLLGAWLLRHKEIEK